MKNEKVNKKRRFLLKKLEKMGGKSLMDAVKEIQKACRRMQRGVSVKLRDRRRGSMEQSDEIRVRGKR